MSLLNITRGLREGLGIADEAGLLVGDVAEGGPADAAGIKSGDVIRSLDGRRVEELSFEQLYRYWYALPASARVDVQISHEGVARTASLQAVIAPHECERPSTLEGLDDEIVEPLALFGMPVDEDGGGVMVSARIAGPAVGAVDLQSGDVVKAVNRTPVTTVASLREAIAAVPRGHTAVLQVERNGALTYLEFDR
jgi:serine protease Do